MLKAHASSLLPPSPHRLCLLRQTLCLGQAVKFMGSGPTSLLLGPFPEELGFIGMQQEPALEKEDKSAQRSGVSVLPTPTVRAQG